MCSPGRGSGVGGSPGTAVDGGEEPSAGAASPFAGTSPVGAASRPVAASSGANLLDGPHTVTVGSKHRPEARQQNWPAAHGVPLQTAAARVLASVRTGSTDVRKHAEAKAKSATRRHRRIRRVEHEWSRVANGAASFGRATGDRHREQELRRRMEPGAQSLTPHLEHRVSTEASASLPIGSTRSERGAQSRESE